MKMKYSLKKDVQKEATHSRVKDIPNRTVRVMKMIQPNSKQIVGDNSRYHLVPAS